ncbi:MAG: mechanosensitive ion channel family protein, partial [Otoolea sp.]
MGLYVLLVISIISILGVPMASVIAVLASAGVAVGLALQGALSNLAGGIMLMILKPFKLGDYVSASGVEGVVKELTLFYTVFMTVDNKKITVPNGSLMNANITNFSSEALRRVDLTFSCAKSEAPSKVQDIMITVMKANPQVLSDPA